MDPRPTTTQADRRAREAADARAREQADEAAVDAPRPITVAGRTLLVAKATKADLSSIRTFILRRVKTPIAALVEDPAFQAMPPESRVRAADLAAARQIEGRADLDANEATLIASSPAGVAFSLWLFCRRNHPALTLEDCKALVTDDNVDAVNIDLGEACGMAELVGNVTGSAGSPPTTPRA